MATLMYKNIVPKKIYYNNTEVKKVYYNNVQVWATPPISGTLAIGNTVTFDSKKWIVVHNSGNLWYLAYLTIVKNTAFGSNTTYKGSTIAELCTTWMNENISDNAKLFMQNVTVENVTNKVFIPSYIQATSNSSGFSWYTSGDTQTNYSHRMAKYKDSPMADPGSWWLSTGKDSSHVYCISTEGVIGLHVPTTLTYAGIRPHICIQL